MKKKLLSAVLSVAMIATVLAGCGGSGASTSQTGAAGESTAAAAAEEGSSAASAATSTDGVKITVLNTKSEIQTQWEELAAEYKDITGVDVEVSVTVGDSPSQDITKRYASGEVPTIFMGDIQDIIMLDEYALDLSNEDWAKDGGSAVAVDVQKARRDVPPGRVQRLRGLAAGPDGRDLPAADADIRPERRAAAPVDDRAPANDPIQHEYLLLNAFIIAYFPGKSTRTVDFCRDVGYNKENPSSEVTPMAVKIEKDTIIGDVLDLAPETAPLFQAIGMHCLGCPASRGESVEEACMVHGVDPDAFLAQVNHFIEAVEANK